MRYNTYMSYIYAEDAFEDFYELVINRNIIPDKPDRSPITSFGNIIISKRQFTEKQAQFAIKLLSKYQKQSVIHGLDYEEVILNPKWKNSFRSIDYSRKIWIEQDEEHTIWVCLKFPYRLKESFEHTVANKMDAQFNDDIYDKDRSVRMMQINCVNFVSLEEFVNSNGFEKDKSYEDILSFINEALLNSDNIIPKSVIKNNEVILKNSTQENNTFFNSNKTGNIKNDLLLAKSMGIYFSGNVSNTIEQICSLESNIYWLEDDIKFFSISKELEGTIVYVRDRSVQAIPWMKGILAVTDQLNIPREDIVVCFRESEQFNNFLKEQGVTGKIGNQKYFFFEYKPPKWLFSKKKDVKLIGTDVLFMNQLPPITRHWFGSHPCVININKSKPVFGSFEEKNIVKL